MISHFSSILFSISSRMKLYEVHQISPSQKAFLRPNTTISLQI